MKTVKLSEEYQVHCFKEELNRFESVYDYFMAEIFVLGWIGMGEEYELLKRLCFKDLEKIVYIGNIDESKNHKYRVQNNSVDDNESEWVTNFKQSLRKRKIRVIDFNNVLKEIGISLEDLKSTCEDYEWIIIEKI